MSYWSFWSLGHDSYAEPRSRVWIPVDYLNIKITYTYILSTTYVCTRYLCLVRYIHTCVCAISTYLCSMLTVNGMLFVCLCLYNTYLYYVDCTSTYANISNEFQQPYNVSFLNNELFFFNKKKKTWNRIFNFCFVCYFCNNDYNICNIACTACVNLLSALRLVKFNQFSYKHNYCKWNFTSYSIKNPTRLNIIWKVLKSRYFYVFILFLITTI